MVRSRVSDLNAVFLVGAIVVKVIPKRQYSFCTAWLKFVVIKQDQKVQMPYRYKTFLLFFSTDTDIFTFHTSQYEFFLFKVKGSQAFVGYYVRCNPTGDPGLIVPATHCTSPNWTTTLLFVHFYFMQFRF